MTHSTCLEAECARPVVARGMCSSHYSSWYRRNNKTPRTCTGCGEEFMAPRPNSMFCNLTCANIHHLPLAHQAPRKPRPKKPATPRLTPDELAEKYRGQRSALRAAYEDGEYDKVIEAIKDRSSVTATGCWEWQGKKRQAKKSKTAYPVLEMSKRSLMVHRIACEARHGKPLGKQHAHHTCANTMCVNPDHVVPATHADNMAEMKARKDYVNRIKQLEEALREIDPSHPVFDEIQLG